jgi:glycerol-3-phosphate O-acyltransferase/dihydroxyacetone phosphate acyltransferase
MALGAMEKYGCSVTIVPAGFNYYNPQNFRSKVILEFGEPFKIPEEMVHLYKQDKKAAIAKLLDLLESVKKYIYCRC